MTTKARTKGFDKDLVRTALAGHWVSCLADLTGATPEQIMAKAGPCWICRDGNDRYTGDANIAENGGAFCRRCKGGCDGFGLLARSRGKDQAGPEEFNDCGKWLVEAGIATQGDLRSQNKPREDVINMQSNQNGDAKAKPTGVDATAAESLNSEELPAPILHDKLPVFANAKEAAKAYCELRPSDSIHLYHQTPDLCSFVYTSRIHGEGEAKALGIGSLFRPIHKTSTGWQGSLQMRTGRPLYAKYPRLLSGYRRSVASSSSLPAGSRSINIKFENVADLADADCVHVCEDERDADAILAMGLNATTTSGGQSSIGMTDLQGLSGKRLILLPKLHEHHHAYIRQFRGVVEASVPGVTISVKCLSDDKTFTSDRGFGADDWLQNYLREAKLHDDQDELLSDELKRLREKLVRILEELPDHSEDDTFAPEKLGPSALQPADHSKKLHNGPLAAVGAAIFGLLSNDVISERRPPDRHFLYFTGPEQHEDGLLFVSLRWDLSESEAATNRHGDKKVIRQIARVEGGWQCRNPYNVGRPLYKLHEPIEGVTAADSDVIFVSEGEPACDALRSIGLPAVCLSQGAASPKATDLSPLDGKIVVWIPDHDEPGEKFVRNCRHKLETDAPNATSSVKCLIDDSMYSEAIKPGDDAVDWLRFRDGESPANLRKIIESLPDKSAEQRFASEASKSRPNPHRQEASGASRESDREEEIERFKNYEHVSADEGEDPQKAPLSLTEIALTLNTKTNSWPRTADGLLFVPCGHGAIRYLKNTTELFTWIGEQYGTPADFVKSYHSRDEFFAHLVQHCKRYESVEYAPHFPSRRESYYCHDDIPNNADGEFLREFLEFFNPETDADKALLTAFVLTLAWGGPCGKRPAFVIEADGQGSGKSVLAHQVAELFGGYITLRTSSKDFDKSISRMLTPSSFTRRMLLMDNLKSMKLSIADLESLITEPTLSGHRYYHGEGTRPNNLTLTITANSPSLGTDLSERAIVIKIRRSKFSATWDDDVAKFVETNRVEIWADVIAMLSAKTEPVTPVSRFGPWENEVLAKVPGSEAAQRVLITRQKEINGDFESLNSFEDEIACRLDSLSYEMGFSSSGESTSLTVSDEAVEMDCVFISNATMAQWYTEFSGIRTSSESIKQRLKILRMKRVTMLHDHRVRSDRGFVFGPWEGKGHLFQNDLDERLRREVIEKAAEIRAASVSPR